MKQLFSRLGTAISGGAKNLLKGIIERRYLVLVIALCVLLDQVTKLLAIAYLEPIDTLPLWKDVLHLTYLENRGAAFGMLADNRAVFMVVSTIGITLFIIYLFAKKERIPLFDGGLTLVIGGGIGNMIDRVVLGYVVDFIDFTLINFAIFNGADSFVSVGAAMMFLSLFLQLLAEAKKKKPLPQCDKEEP